MRHPAGFTLLEVLAVVLLTSLVIGVALNHYIDLTRATQRASGHTRGVRHAAALLDRVARDLESTILVIKPPEVDPLAHPWIFFAEQRRSESGADQLKFITTSGRPRATAVHGSDLSTVVYSLRSSEDEESFELMRWSTPSLPEPGSDLRRLPSDESEGARLVADGLLDFGVVFLDEEEQQLRSWDSSQLVESSALPVSAQIQVAFADDLPTTSEFEEGPRSYQRTVPIRVQPLDLDELYDPTAIVNGGTGEEGAEDEEDEDDPCQQTPCAGQLACEVIDCQGKLGRFGQTADGILQQALDDDLEFCAWRKPIGPQLLNFLVEDPACR